MRAITSGELTRKRDDAESRMPDTCTRTRTTYSDDGYGGSSEATATTNYACNRRPAGNVPTEILESGQLQGVTLWEFRLPYSADVTASDEITYDGDEYQVLGVTDDPSWDIETVVYCQKITT